MAILPPTSSVSINATKHRLIGINTFSIKKLSLSAINNLRKAVMKRAKHALSFSRSRRDFHFEKRSKNSRPPTRCSPLKTAPQCGHEFAKGITGPWHLPQRFMDYAWKIEK